MTKLIVTLETLKACNRFVSNDEKRYYLKGVFFDNDKKLLAATDGRQLIIAKPVQDMPDFESFILPSGVIKKLKGGTKFRTAYVMIDTEKKELGVFDFTGDSPNQSTWHDCFERIETKTKTKYTPIDGTFPPYARVVPDAINYTCTIRDNGRAFSPELMGTLGGAVVDITWFFHEDKGAPAIFRCNKQDHFEAFGALIPMRGVYESKDVTPAWWNADKGQEKAA